MIGNQFWNATRVRNFMKKLNKKSTTFDENIKVLAQLIGISVEKFLNMDPITYGTRVFAFGGGTHTVMYLLGPHIYDHYLDNYKNAEQMKLNTPYFPPVHISY